MVSSLTDYGLYRGNHDESEGKRCSMEWVAYLAGESHTDTPECVSPYLSAIVQRINDILPTGERQQLRPYLERLIGTAYDWNQWSYWCEYRRREAMSRREERATWRESLDRLLPLVSVELPIVAVECAQELAYA